MRFTDTYTHLETIVLRLKTLKRIDDGDDGDKSIDNGGTDGGKDGDAEIVVTDDKGVGNEEDGGAEIIDITWERDGVIPLAEEIASEAETKGFATMMCRRVMGCELEGGDAGAWADL